MEAKHWEGIGTPPLPYYSVRDSSEFPSEEIQHQEDFSRFIPNMRLACQSKQSNRLDLQPSFPSTITPDASEELSFQRKEKDLEPEQKGARVFHAVVRADNRRHRDYSDYEEQSLPSSSHEFPCSRRHVSQEPSRSLYAAEFDYVSHQQPASSASPDRRHHEEPRPRRTLTAFLVLLALASVVAVLIDSKWEPQATSNNGHPVSRDARPVTAMIAERSVENQDATTVTTATMITRNTSQKGKKRYFAPGDAITHVTMQAEEMFTSLISTIPSNTPRLKKKRAHKLSSQTRKLAHSRSKHRRPAEETSRATSTFKRPQNVLSAPIHRPTKHRCGMAFYTYCSALRDETYYRHATRSCVRTVTDRTQVCNHSPNRFATLQACKKRCAQGELPAEPCFEKTLFSGCNREDVSSSWWFFNGKHCQAWNFPDGLCPDPAGSNVFASRSECLRRCSVRPQVLSRRHRGVVRNTPCRRPKAGAVCSVDVLKFPYFADISPVNGRVECLNSSASQLRKRRCLTGSNRFLSDATCRRACVLTAMRRRPQHVLFDM